MRYVEFDPRNLDEDALPDEEKAEVRAWLTAAAEASSKSVDDYEATGTASEEVEAIWRAHKKWLLRNKFAKKCAYCEKSLSDIPVDAEHWRPKRRVTNATVQDHPGYFWLAYSWRNLLPACSMCNSYDGKKNQFPVTNAHVFRVRLTDAELAQLGCPEEAIPSTVEPGTYYLGAQDLDAIERPLLLHPFVDTDPSEHLEFRSSGQVRGRTPKGEWSIKVFALNREDLQKARANAYLTIRRMVSQSIVDAREVGGFENEEAVEEAREVVTRLFGARTPYLSARHAALEDVLAHERKQLDD